MRLASASMPREPRRRTARRRSAQSWPRGPRPGRWSSPWRWWLPMPQVLPGRALWPPGPARGRSP
eukprot:15436261-Alexandrium_andersonii.AAC.1